MAKIAPIANVTAGHMSAAKLNDAFDKVEAAFANTLSRDGSTPNTMSADLDLNGNDIINAGALNVESLTVDGVPIESLVSISLDLTEGFITLTGPLDFKKEGNLVSFTGLGNVDINTTTTATNFSSVNTTATYSQIMTQSTADIWSKLKLLRAGGYNLTANYASGVVSMIEGSDNKTELSYTDSAANLSQLELTEDGLVRLRSTLGDIRLCAGTGSTLAPIALDSDGSGTMLRIEANGALSRTHPDAYKVLGGVNAPIDNTTVGYARHQLYLDRSTGALYFCDTKSTDPDSAGTGSDWLPTNAGFTTPAITITAGAGATVAHGLGDIATKGHVDMWLNCVTTDLNYDVGDKIRISPGAFDSNFGISVLVNATNIKYRMGSNAAVFQYPHANTGALTAITPANWQLFIRVRP